MPVVGPPDGVLQGLVRQVRLCRPYRPSPSGHVCDVGAWPVLFAMRSGPGDGSKPRHLHPPCIARSPPLPPRADRRHRAACRQQSPALCPRSHGSAVDVCWGRWLRVPFLTRGESTPASFGAVARAMRAHAQPSVGAPVGSLQERRQSPPLPPASCAQGFCVCGAHLATSDRWASPSPSRTSSLPGAPSRCACEQWSLASAAPLGCACVGARGSGSAWLGLGLGLGLWLGLGLGFG